MHRALALAALPFISCVLGGCIYLPRTTTIYDERCHVEAKHMEMQMAQIGALGHCQGQGCAELLVAAGAVAAASAVVTGSIVVTGNVVYWFEKQGRCLAGTVGG
ncbi:MAG TPA: hypothetical protein VFI86_07775 [Burkholderiales bacterium]|nr:hypothetical protein [Burkholderiales bacterium]